MLLLVTDTSGRNGNVALVRAGEPDAHEVAVIEVSALSGGTFSAQLVPQIADLLAAHGLPKGDIGAFVVVSGPGSFTGLRVGLAAIKALAEILRKPIVAVSLLEAVALAGAAQGNVASVLDAGRGDVYLGKFQVVGESAQALGEELLPKDSFLSAAHEFAIATPDLALAELARNAGRSVSVVEPVGAEAISRLGWKKLQAGESISPEQLEANYVRRDDEIFAKSS
jgi:tRNA threonylcarbamoyladenosine biosynthesis protein TsaB